MNEIVRIEISKELLQILIDSDVITPSNYKLLIVDVDGYDYSGNKEWMVAKQISDRSYKYLKKLEFNIRHDSL